MSKQFDKELKKASNKIKDAIEKTLRATAVDMFSKIILRTPVDTGRLRGNWQASVQNPILSELDTTSKTGNETIATGKTNINTYKLDDKSIWFSNNLPYAVVIEDGGVNRRPYGMVKTTLKIFEPVLTKFAKANRV